MKLPRPTFGLVLAFAAALACPLLAANDGSSGLRSPSGAKARVFSRLHGTAKAMPYEGAGHAPPSRPQRRAPQPAVRREEAQAARARPRLARQVPPNWMGRLHKMSPEEQRRFLENNQRFRQLPPAEQARIRANLEQWNRLTPQQKQVLNQRARILQRLSPEERQELRQVILPEWQHLPPARRRVLVRKLLALQMLNDAQRQRRLQDPHFLRGLSPGEEKLLGEMARLKVSPGEGRP